MESYISIPHNRGQNLKEFRAHVFDKLDGQLIRAEWNHKEGFVKFGSKTALFDEGDPVFGEAITIFYRDWSNDLSRIARDNRWSKLTAFLEFYGQRSLAGRHVVGDPKQLTLIDAHVKGRGILGPKEFLQHFDHLPIPNYLGEFNWTRSFVETVRMGELEGVTFEGVVGKAGKKRKLVMAKAKSQSWIDSVTKRFSEKEAAS